MLDEFQYTLKNGIEYGGPKTAGELVTASFVTLKAPTSRHLKYTAYLKQQFVRCLPRESAGESEGNDISEKEGKDSIKGSDVMMIITQSQTVGLLNVLLSGKELLTSGVAFLDGETKMNKIHVDSMSQDDLENMLGEYLINFILASVLRNPKKN